MKITLAAIVLPGSSRSNKTGAWRSQRPILDPSMCNRCKLCYYFCPDSSIRIVDGIYTIDYNYCKGCGICMHECPRSAITMVAERE